MAQMILRETAHKDILLEDVLSLGRLSHGLRNIKDKNIK